LKKSLKTTKEKRRLTQLEGRDHKGTWYKKLPLSSSGKQTALNVLQKATLIGENHQRSRHLQIV